MHIVLVTITYPPESGWGGIGSYVYHMARSLRAIGQTVTVLCGFSAQPRDYGEDSVRVLCRLDTRTNAPLSVPAQVNCELERLLACREIDIVEFPEYSALGLDFQRAHPEFPVVVKLHGDTELCFLGKISRWKALVQRVYRPAALRARIALEKESVSRAHGVVSPSKWQLDSCLRRGWPVPSDCEIVPNPYTPLRTLDDAPPTRYVDRKILWLARLEPRKGITLLPSIACALWREVPDAEFHLIGQIPSRRDDWAAWVHASVPQSRRSQVVIHGGLPYLDVLRRLEDYSVAVFASTWESFSYTQVECMSAGHACVNASGSGARELGSDGQHLLDSRRRAADIAHGVATLLVNPEFREKLGRAASEHVREKFAGPTVAAKMLSVYEQTLRQARRPPAT